MKNTVTLINEEFECRINSSMRYGKSEVLVSNTFFTLFDLIKIYYVAASIISQPAKFTSEVCN